MYAYQEAMIVYFSPAPIIDYRARRSHRRCAGRAPPSSLAPVQGPFQRGVREGGSGPTAVAVSSLFCPCPVRRGIRFGVSTSTRLTAAHRGEARWRQR